MRQDGLTLIEVLICLSILVILTTQAVPALDELIHQQRAKSYLQQFSRHLHYARVKASSTQQPTIVCPIRAGQCQGSWQQDPLQLLLADPFAEQTIPLRQLPALPKQHQLSYNRNQLQFRRDGSLDALQNGTFVYCPPARFNWHYRLVINQAGRSRLQYISQGCG